ncbi:MAG: hypothetical protein QOG81_138, partial [Gaiellaceae bacterium]|nr:hypothetical protein [Gaiellaceae bacterium]
ARPELELVRNGSDAARLLASL